MTTATAWGAIIVSPQLRMLVRRLTDEMIAAQMDSMDDGSIYLDYPGNAIRNSQFRISKLRIQQFGACSTEFLSLSFQRGTFSVPSCTAVLYWYRTVAYTILLTRDL